MREINELIIHCSDSPDNLDIGAKEIREWHTLPPPYGRGWDDIGYHFVIRRDGTIEEGRPVGVVGAHCRGHNRHSIGVCIVGRDHFSDAQWDTLDRVVEGWKTSGVKIKGHYQYNPMKTCPNFDVEERYGG